MKFKMINGRRARVLEGSLVYCEKSETTNNVFEFTEIKDGLTIKKSVIANNREKAWRKFFAKKVG